MLDKAQYFGLPWEMKLLSPDQVQINPEQVPEDRLREADMDAETAKSWYTNYLYRGPGGRTSEDRSLRGIQAARKGSDPRRLCPGRYESGGG